MDKLTIEGYSQAIDILLGVAKTNEAAEQAFLRIAKHVQDLEKKNQLLTDMVALFMKSNLPEVKI